MPPSTTRPATQISMADLTKELQKGPSQASPKNDAPPAEDTPPPEQSQRSTAPAPEPGKPLMKGLMDGIKEGMDKKAAAADAKGDNAGTKDEPAKPASKDKKEVVSADDAPPPEKKDPVAPPKPLTEAELDVMPHDSSRTRERITHLNSERKRLAAERAAIAKELEEAKKAPKTAENTEEVARLKAELDSTKELAGRLQRAHDWENDPGVKAKYREPVALAEKTIEDAFKRAGYGEPTLKAIKDAGGYAAFSRSQATYPVEVADPEAEGGKKIVNYTAAELARSFLARMPVADAELVRQSVGRQELLQSEEKAARQKAQEDYKGYYENQTKAQREAGERQAAETKRLSDEYASWQTKTEGETEWLKDRAVPDNASDEQKAQIGEYNKTQAELRESLKTHPKTALEYGELKLQAARSRHLDRTLAEKDQEIERLTAELKRKSAAQKTTGKGGSLLVKDGHKPDAEKPKPGSTDFMAAFHASMKQKAGAADDE